MSNVISKKKTQPSLRHGHVFSPKSRAYFSWEAGRMNIGQLNQREAGKYFPQLASGLQDPLAPDDQRNNLPPPDGRIASANQGDSAFLDEPGSHWQKHDVESHQLLTVSWHYTARHLTRRWNYFITRPNWNPNLPLSRNQFEEKPFWQVQLSEQPFWRHGEALNPPNPTVHDVMLPERAGYHVLLAVWEVADTGNAFYQVVDLNFVGASDTTDLPPTAPTNLHSMGVGANSVSLMWGPSSSAGALQGYIVYRDGNEISRRQASQLSYEDASVVPATSYRYFVVAIDVQARLSVPSNVLNITTLEQEHGGDNEDAEEGLRQWARGETWQTGERVRHSGRVWVCLQQHTSWVDSWAPGAIDGFTLWGEVC